MEENDRNQKEIPSRLPQLFRYHRTDKFVDGEPYTLRGVSTVREGAR